MTFAVNDVVAVAVVIAVVDAGLHLNSKTVECRFAFERKIRKWTRKSKQIKESADKRQPPIQSVQSPRVPTSVQ